jgi:hypothetical protein
MTSVPLNLGDAVHEKLEADQWHADMLADV